ncbi:hypothetical protein HPB50_020093 [Hyalomma asiaticum]|uniref:Uncharacterized protein n=1 Tax=Hyalomma asiaticum TaxID=266040 RepID=A0ACB7RL29_HYAAI|nr:hypothetical protein HPB50_020093 [Hyalomma asiaticum]
MAHTLFCTGQEPASSTRNIEAAEAARGPISHSGCVPTAAEHRYPRFPAKTKRPQRALRRPARQLRSEPTRYDYSSLRQASPRCRITASRETRASSARAQRLDSTGVTSPPGSGRRSTQTASTHCTAIAGRVGALLDLLT